MLRSLLIASITLVGAATGMAQAATPVIGQGALPLSSTVPAQMEGGIKSSFFCSFACSAGACGGSPMILKRCLALCPAEATLECRGGAKSAEAAVMAGGVEAAGSLARVALLAPPGQRPPGSAPLPLIPSSAKASAPDAAKAGTSAKKVNKEDSEEGEASESEGEEHNEDEEPAESEDSGEKAAEGEDEASEPENTENEEEGAAEED